MGRGGLVESAKAKREGCATPSTLHQSAPLSSLSNSLLPTGLSVFVSLALCFCSGRVGVHSGRGGIAVVPLYRCTVVHGTNVGTGGPVK